ncbi:enoyl-CoA hydratase [Minwuia thermotolerans]|uniref:Enoyl-CoA hydratase n=1 Tax=Minwuia thermotolerans TaxID=2056226 RepID=A0A2M9G508_9PROT|nr:enoyl-CoA hydratase [Minwuia thermotolerans]PJK30809.1 enoyl-CoA hydratase [Minwuia thermotolerans]
MQLSTTKMKAEARDGVGWIIFNQPEKRNAVSVEMWAAVPQIMAYYDADPEVRCVVLKGAGEQAFIAGADISEFGEKRNSPEATKHYDAVSAEAHRALALSPKPTIAMINGFCIGGGVAVALSTDIRIAADNGRFAVPAARLGLGYGAGGLKRLIDVVGPAFAKEIFFTARQFDAAEALAMGLVNRVVPAAELESYVLDYARRIAENAPLTIRAAKMTIDELLKDAERRDLAACEAAISQCFASADYAEGRTAFMEKRKPRFRGV